MHRQTCAAAAVVIALSVSGARAQQTPPASPTSPAARVPTVPTPLLLKIQFVISRYQGEKKIGSEPYTMTVRANEARSSLRMGWQVPITTLGPENKTTVVYKEVGTNIDCGAQTLEDGRFRLDVSLEDSSISADAQKAQASIGVPPQIRSFRLSNETLVLRDGQTSVLTTATEKASGETAKIDVILSVIR